MFGTLTTKQSPVAALASATPFVTATLAPTNELSPTRTPQATFGPTGPTTEALFIRAIDGDTIVVAVAGQEQRVRYIGMDAPETVDPNDPVQWMGPQAAEANRTLVAGKTLHLERDVSETDSFGRLLRHVWVTDGVVWTLVGAELVRQGVAIAKSYPPDVRFDGLLAAAQVDAQRSSLGLWAPTPPTPPPATPTPTPLSTATPAATLIPFAPPAPDPVDECHPSYEPCLPVTSDLDCPDVRAIGAAPVNVIGPDSYRLDRDGDGLGCE